MKGDLKVGILGFLFLMLTLYSFERKAFHMHTCFYITWLQALECWILSFMQQFPMHEVQPWSQDKCILVVVSFFFPLILYSSCLFVFHVTFTFYLHIAKRHEPLGQGCENLKPGARPHPAHYNFDQVFHLCVLAHMVTMINNSSSVHVKICLVIYIYI